MESLTPSDTNKRGPRVPAALIAMDEEGTWVQEAVRVLGNGGLVALPTDTVYGVAAALSNPTGPAQIFEAKRRPGQTALAVLVSDTGQAALLAEGLDGPLGVLARRFWPGPLTIVFSRRVGLGVSLGGDESTVGLRCPAQDALRQLCDEVGPLITTSANIHGHPPAHSAAEAIQSLDGYVSLVIDGGIRDGAPSTVVTWSGHSLAVLREGPLNPKLLHDAIHEGSQ